MKKINLLLVTFCICLFYSAGVLALTDKENLFANCIIVNFDSEFENSKAVFIGEVTDIEKDGDKKIIEFKVKKYWKGIEKDTVKIYVYESLRFEPLYNIGEIHLIFAKDDGKSGLWDNKCSRSKDLDKISSDLEDDLKALGKGKTFTTSKDKKLISAGNCKNINLLRPAFFQNFGTSGSGCSRCKNIINQQNFLTFDKIFPLDFKGFFDTHFTSFFIHSGSMNRRVFDADETFFIHFDSGFFG